jgi:hypothetical protein
MQRNICLSILAGLSKPHRSFLELANTTPRRAAERPLARGFLIKPVIH